MLQLKQVTVVSKLGHTLLDQIDLTIFPGDRVSIIGGSGAGKTSCLKLINCLYSPSQGSIAFRDQDYQAIPPQELRRNIVLVPQEPKLLQNTVKESLVYPLTLQKIAPSEIKQRLLYWTGQLGIGEDWLERTELELSLGQRQLVAIARGLMMNPEVLLLDEPTSALDYGRAHNLINLLRHELSQTIAVVMVNHQLDLVEKFSDRVIMMAAGTITFQSPRAQINWPEIKQQFQLTQTNSSDF
jgi:D-methionine transport system ATP-binding protein